MTGIVILAAGASVRMGQPKQQLKLGQQTLLQHAAETALQVNDAVVYVVLGAGSTAIAPDIATLPVQIVYNAQWQQGMASSIQAGIKALMADIEQVQNVLLMLCDQPFVHPALLNQLIDKQGQRSKAIVACAYEGIMGAPVIFDRCYFADLLALQGQEGAKKLLAQYHEKVTAIDFDNGGIDIDTPADYEQLIRSSGG